MRDLECVIAEARIDAFPDELVRVFGVLLRDCRHAIPSKRFLHLYIGLG